MAVANKKHYKTLLKLLSATETCTKLANQLSALSIDADDPKLKHYSEFLAELIRLKAGDKDFKMNILELARRYQHSTGPGHKKRGDEIFQIKHYCDNTLLSIQPEWQIIALGQGWTPPTAKK